MSIDYFAIGQRIQKKRKACSKTQDMLAEYLSVSVGYVSQLERGVTKINLDTLARISEYLHCDMAELINGTSSTAPNYLQSEIMQSYEKLDDRKKKFLLAIAHILNQY